MINIMKPLLNKRLDKVNLLKVAENGNSSKIFWYSWIEFVELPMKMLLLTFSDRSKLNIRKLALK